MNAGEKAIAKEMRRQEQERRKQMQLANKMLIPVSKKTAMTLEMISFDPSGVFYLNENRWMKIFKMEGEIGKLVSILRNLTGRIRITLHMGEDGGRATCHLSLMESGELARGRDPNESVEFNDNRISAFVVQQGNCYITGQKLNANNMKCFRKLPLIQGGTNKHGNIAFVEPRVYNLIFNDNINEAKIQLTKLKLEESKRNRLNRIRRNYGYQSI